MGILNLMESLTEAMEITQRDKDLSLSKSVVQGKCTVYTIECMRELKHPIYLIS